MSHFWPRAAVCKWGAPEVGCDDSAAIMWRWECAWNVWRRAQGGMWHALNVIDCVVIAKDSLPAASGTPFRSIHCLFVLLLINFTACAETYWELKQLLYWWISLIRGGAPCQARYFSPGLEEYCWAFLKTFILIRLSRGGFTDDNGPQNHFLIIVFPVWMQISRSSSAYMVIMVMGFQQGGGWTAKKKMGQRG